MLKKKKRDTVQERQNLQGKTPHTFEIIFQDFFFFFREKEMRSRSVDVAVTRSFSEGLRHNPPRRRFITCISDCLVRSEAICMFEEKDVNSADGVPGKKKCVLVGRLIHVQVFFCSGLVGHHD